MIGILPLISGAQTAPAARDVIRFEDLPRLVSERNENVAAARSTLEAEKVRTGFLGRSFLPEISLSGGGEVYKAGSASALSRENWKIEGRVNLYRGGRDRWEENAREAEVRRAQVASVAELADELKSARLTYWRLLAVEQSLAARMEARVQNEEQLKSARRRTGAGIATSSDAVQFELQDTVLHQEIKKLTKERTFLSDQLRASLGIADGGSLAIDQEFPHPPETDATVKPLEPLQAAAVRELVESEHVAQARARQESRWWTPSLDAYSSYGVPSAGEEPELASRRETEFIAGIRLGLNLPVGAESRAETQARRHEAQALRQRSTQMARQVAVLDVEIRGRLRLLH
ncbi:MAG: TolC family protein, partial [Bdellovibrionaceae bacterium]|nr:TolC family protein [Pseudobdellovibrionaceae bacterium]